VVGGGEPAEVAQLLVGLPPSDSRAIVVHGTAAGAIPVRDTTKLEGGRVYAVSPDDHVELRDGSLVVPQASVRGNTLDALLRSAGDAYGAQVVGVLLGGRHGLLGMRRIKEVNGVALAHATTQLADVDMTGTLDELAAWLRGSCDERERPSSAEGPDTLGDIVALLQTRLGVDFTPCKRAALHRRIARRMQLLQIESIVDYFQRLERDDDELARLRRDVLTSASAFFRDADAFVALGRDVLPKVFASAGKMIRVWVPGCATGEEAYSLAMVLREYAEKAGDARTIRVFATDLDRDALTEARIGEYSDAIEADVEPARLERYFEREGDRYRITNELREMAVFACHDMLHDAPFSQLDLISCRNVLAYFNRETQDRLLRLFHFALRTDGSLFLGAADGAVTAALFAPLDAKTRIFARHAAESLEEIEAILRTPRKTELEDVFQSEIVREQLDAANAALRVTKATLLMTRQELESTQRELKSSNVESVALNREMVIRGTELDTARDRVAELLILLSHVLGSAAVAGRAIELIVRPIPEQQAVVRIRLKGVTLELTQEFLARFAELRNGRVERDRDELVIELPLT
jgi:chemotaxis methyl-accepting protein methylase